MFTEVGKTFKTKCILNYKTIREFGHRFNTQGDNTRNIFFIIIKIRCQGNVMPA